MQRVGRSSLNTLPLLLRRRCFSVWQGTTPATPDPILGMTAAFVEDTSAKKVNVGQGLYRTDEGTPFVLPSVLEAERRVSASLADGTVDKEYLPIEGDATFRRLSAELVFGADSSAIRTVCGDTSSCSARCCCGRW